MVRCLLRLIILSQVSCAAKILDFLILRVEARQPLVAARQPLAAEQQPLVAARQPLVAARQPLVVARRLLVVLDHIVVTVLVATTHLPVTDAMDRGRATMRLRAQIIAYQMAIGIVLILRVLQIHTPQEILLRQIVHDVN
jgi:hypothetical protein